MLYKYECGCLLQSPSPHLSNLQYCLVIKACKDEVPFNLFMSNGLYHYNHNKDMSFIDHNLTMYKQIPLSELEELIYS